MLAKFINENKLKWQNKTTILYRDNVQIINPTNEDYILDGYKEVISKIEPDYDINNEYLVPIYKEDDKYIYENWIINIKGDEK